MIYFSLRLKIFQFLNIISSLGKRKLEQLKHSYSASRSVTSLNLSSILHCYCPHVYVITHNFTPGCILNRNALKTHKEMFITPLL